MSFVKAPVQLITKESAVDMVAAKMPANITPTKNGGNNLMAIEGKANSGSKLPSLTKIILANIPTKMAAPKNAAYQE